MDCQEFMPKKDSSSSSQNEDQQIFGDDQPTNRKVVQKQTLRNNQDDSTRGVVIMYNMEDVKSQNLNDQIHSESGKSSALSSRTRPSIYNESQRSQMNYCERERNMRKNRPYKDTRVNVLYFYPQKYQNQYQENQHQQYHHNGNRNNYRDYQNHHNRNQNYQNKNNFGNQRRHQHDNRRWDQNGYYQRQNDYYDNDYNGNQMCYQRENHRYQHNQRPQRQQHNYRPQRQQNNHRNQRQQYQGQSHYHDRKQNFQRKKYQYPQDQYKYEEQKRQNQRNDKQKNSSTQQKMNPISKPNQQPTQLKSDFQERKQFNKLDSTKRSKKSNTQNQKPLIKENNPKQIQTKQVKIQQQKSKKLQQKNQNQRPLILKPQQKPQKQTKKLQQKQNKKLLQKPLKQTKKQIKTMQIKNDQLELFQSQEQNGLNKLQKNIQLNQSQKQKKEMNQKQKQKQELSDWDPSQDNEQNQNQDQDQNLDKQSFECHQISLQPPLTPPIANNSHNLSNYEEDLPLLEELRIQNKVISNEKISQKMKEKPIEKKKTQNNSNNSNLQDQQFSFSQKQLKTMTKMFDVLPQNQSSVFIELKIKTSNVSVYKIKTISSEIFNLKGTFTEQVKDHPFIKILSSEKSVPRDVIPQSYGQEAGANKNDGSKKSKLVLALIKYPLNLLQHKIKYVQEEQRQILKKIEKNKKLFEDFNQLISVDQITLRCSSCHRKKTFLWNNNIIPHLCKADCPNFLRFNIESMYIC